MIFFYIFSPLVLLLSLYFPGFVFNRHFKEKKYFNLNKIIFGFLFLILVGTLISIISFDLVSNQKTWIISYVFIIFSTFIYLYKNKLIKESIYSIFSIEILLFILIFLLLIFIRLLNPDIINTEKIMEFMILTSVLEGSNFVPKDLWFHNNNISYYSYGYFIFSSIPNILYIKSEIAFNLILPIVISLSFLSVNNLLFTLGSKLYNAKYFLLPFFCFIFIFFFAPLASIIEFINHAGLGSQNFYNFISIEGINQIKESKIFWPEDNWWWFSISRIIGYKNSSLGISDYTINEFPAFSIILGDIHPHLLAVPFLILSFALIFNLFKEKRFANYDLFLMNLLILITILINPWYLVPIIWFLFINIFFLYIKSFNKIFNNLLFIKLIGPTLIIVLITIIFINPSNQLGFPYIRFVKISSKFHHLILYWGFSLIPINIYLFKNFFLDFNKSSYYKVFIFIVVFLMILTLLSNRFFIDFSFFINYVLILILFSFTLSTTIILILRNNKDKYLLILILSNVSIIYGTEFFYIIDLFNNRMNTIFKFYYVSYIILNIISFYVIYLFLKNISSIKKYLFIVFVLIILSPSLWWTVASIKSRNSENLGSISINGLNYLSEYDKDAIIFIKQNIPKNETVLEGVGKSYTKSNIFSSSTGRSTVLGWVNHQLQWRNDSTSIMDLNNEIEDFYINPSVNHEIINKFKISYIIYSDYEKLRYKKSKNSNFNQFNLIFQNKKINIYSIK